MQSEMMVMGRKKIWDFINGKTGMTKPEDWQNSKEGVNYKDVVYIESGLLNVVKKRVVKDVPLNAIVFIEEFDLYIICCNRDGRSPINDRVKGVDSRVITENIKLRKKLERAIDAKDVAEYDRTSSFETQFDKFTDMRDKIDSLPTVPPLPDVKKKKGGGT